MVEVIEKIQKHARKLKDNREPVSPGMEAAFTEACQPGDGIWQGDLGLEIVEEVPADYEPAKTLTEKDKQLVLGSTQGARHCLETLDGVKLFYPKGWSEESLQGPCFVLAKSNRVLHPVHGAVSIPAGFTVLCRYQREWNKEQAKERRARD